MTERGRDSNQSAVGIRFPHARSAYTLMSSPAVSRAAAPGRLQGRRGENQAPTALCTYRNAVYDNRDSGCSFHREDYLSVFQGWEAFMGRAPPYRTSTRRFHHQSLSQGPLTSEREAQGTWNLKVQVRIGYWSRATNSPVAASQNTPRLVIFCQTLGHLLTHECRSPDAKRVCTLSQALSRLGGNAPISPYR